MSILDQANTLPRPMPRRKPNRNIIYASKKADELRARNAYRLTVGLPLIEPGNN
jgi:hypothetical protein